ncbi:MAG: hypothetical protein ABW094_14670 [Candidatus Thiodiazotropha sp.]
MNFQLLKNHSRLGVLHQRIQSSRRFAFKHLIVSFSIALLCSVLVFAIWYPYPFNEIAGGKDLFRILVFVDVIIGPLLTLIVYNPKKPALELWRDIGIIISLQITALAYGLHSTYISRPVFVGFEGDRFRMVRIVDIQNTNNRGNIDYDILDGPEPIGVKLAKSTDKDFLESIKLAVDGLHPAFRPSRWVKYEEQKDLVVQQVKPISQLKEKHPKDVIRINDMLQKVAVNEGELGFLPLIAGKSTNWVAIVNTSDGSILSFLPFDGW